VFTDVGDEQNIERDLSTFSAHIANLREILSSPAPAPLVLLDEPGVGTDPEEGAALAIGLLEYLERRAARVLVTTHYTPVKKFALARPSCVFAAVDFDVETLTPCYRLTYHSLGRSLALPIAERLGLPEPVLAAARLAQSEESRAFATAIEQLEDTRRRLEVELAKAKASAERLAADEAESRRVLEEIQRNRRKAWDEELDAAREFLRATKHEGRELLRELREKAQASGDRARFDRVVAEREAAIRARAAETAAPPIAAAPTLGPPQIGNTVEVGERGIRGELLSVEGERAWIQRGSLRFEVPAAGLRRIADTAQPNRVAPSARPPEVESAQELSLIGYRAREALVELERFLDRAVQAGHARVRVVHGVGSGALRRAVHEYLAASPYCSQFHPGERTEAVTIVEIAG
jgi:DNA mismatch repair protein MutS2